ncbi:putative m protein repeat protein [Erysiphe necator]|uniref:Putative m protein repeat protein n=1 Tax=Uncinula necator TaxID=52586 RepID=A0A0B1P5Y2_UNCNE|nr:putative m protein repeat protein [Erysiphe necator]
MTAPSQHVSRWGSLFQQAVAGVESRLDNILADGVEESVAVQVASKSSKPSIEVSSHQLITTPRFASAGSKANERLQDRLAKALAAKNGSSKREYSTSSFPSRVSSPASAQAIEDISKFSEKINENKESVESANIQVSQKITTIDPHDGVEQASTSLQHANSEEDVKTGILTEHNAQIAEEDRVSSEVIQNFTSDQPRHDALPLSLISSADLNSVDILKISTEYEALIKKLQSDVAALETQRQEDSHSYDEKIDALQRKLQYMAKEASERANLTGNSASSGSLEKKLADKEHQIALLLEEGLTLSKKELSYLATIKKLRAQLREENKEITTMKSLHESAKKEASYTEERLKKMQSYEKQVNDQQQLINQLRNDIKSGQMENENNNKIIKDLKNRVNEFVKHDTKINTDLLQKSLQAERNRVAELLADKTNLEAEKKQEATEAESTIRNLRILINENEERARVKEQEMKMELQILESKLEVLREKAEEASSGLTGETKARLLRQIETLQTQYSVASENWQGIEASFLAKISNLERDRDEAFQKEIVTRRKAREAVQKAKYTEEELEDLRAKISILQQEISGYKHNFDALQKKAKEAETILECSRISFDQERMAFKIDLESRLAEEKQKWLEEICIGPQSKQNRLLADHPVIREITPISRHINPSLDQVNRRLSGDSILSQKTSRTLLKEKFECVSPYPDPEGIFENSSTSFPSPQITLESKSGSTTGTGISEQLAEKMSSMVHQLKCDKVAMQEDINRVKVQRDEARKEIDNLKHEVEVKKKADLRVIELQKELEDIKMRYETTLVILGEKSEEIDELKGDIQDIKIMYRDLVEKTVK